MNHPITDLCQKETANSPENLQADECVNTRDNIVHHDTNASMDALIKPGYRKRLEDIKEPKQGKT
jgi:hypothetical protein